MGKVILFSGITFLDLPVDRVLENNIGLDHQGVVLMGYDKDGQAFFASTYADGGVVLWMVEQMKLKLLNVEVPDGFITK